MTTYDDRNYCERQRTQEHYVPGRNVLDKLRRLPGVYKLTTTNNYVLPIDKHRCVSRCDHPEGCGTDRVQLAGTDYYFYHEAPLKRHFRRVRIATINFHIPPGDEYYDDVLTTCLYPEDKPGIDISSSFQIDYYQDRGHIRVLPGGYRNYFVTFNGTHVIMRPNLPPYSLDLMVHEFDDIYDFFDLGHVFIKCHYSSVSGPHRIPCVGASIDFFDGTRCDQFTQYQQSLDLYKTTVSDYSLDCVYEEHCPVGPTTNISSILIDYADRSTSLFTKISDAIINYTNHFLSFATDLLSTINHATLNIIANIGNASHIIVEAISTTNTILNKLYDDIHHYSKPCTILQGLINLLLYIDLEYQIIFIVIRYYVVQVFYGRSVAQLHTAFALIHKIFTTYVLC